MSWIKKIWNWIVSIPKDKLLHDYAGALIALFVYAICFRFGVSKWWCFAIGDGVAIVALALKELYDAHHEGHSVELADFLYGLFGVAKVNLALLVMVL